MPVAPWPCNILNTIAHGCFTLLVFATVVPLKGTDHNAYMHNRLQTASGVGAGVYDLLNEFNEQCTSKYLPVYSLGCCAVMHIFQPEGLLYSHQASKPAALYTKTDIAWKVLVPVYHSATG